VLAFVTSRAPDQPQDTDVVLDPDDPDFAQTGLEVRSTIRIHRLLTVASTIIKRELGSLSPGLQARVADAVHRLFALDPGRARGSSRRQMTCSESGGLRAPRERGTMHWSASGVLANMP